MGQACWAEGGARCCIDASCRVGCLWLSMPGVLKAYLMRVRRAGGALASSILAPASQGIHDTRDGKRRYRSGKSKRVQLAVQVCRMVIGARQWVLPDCDFGGCLQGGAATRCFGFKGTGFDLRRRLHQTNKSAVAPAKMSHRSQILLVGARLACAAQAVDTMCHSPL